MFCISRVIAQFIRAAKSGKTAELSALSQALTERGVDINECKDANNVRLPVPSSRGDFNRLDVADTFLL